MCGVSAIYSYRPSGPPVVEEHLRCLHDAMYSRGPDDQGLWVSEDQHIAMAHRRLSILGLGESGRQPMSLHEGRFRVTYNGEIYNYRALRYTLEAKGHRFRTDTDTEVLLVMYAEYGIDMLTQLRGMFAFALWDAEMQCLFLVRDPFGIKPLYYSECQDQVIVASQVKALLQHPNIPTTIEPAGHVGYCVLGHVPEPYTLYKAIRAVPAGHILRIDRHGLRAPQAYFSVRTHLQQAEQSPVLDTENAYQRCQKAIEDSVAHHFISDVPIGLFLSSGIDSALLAAIASEQQVAQLKTVTLGFKAYQGTELDEALIAEQIAQQYQTQHHTAWLSEAAVMSDRKNFFAAMDQPTIDGLNAYQVSRVAKACGLKVAISGVGGDELLGGYQNFHRIPQLVRWCRWAQSMGLLSRVIRHLTHPLLRYLGKAKYAALFEYAHSAAGAYFLLRGLQMPFQVFDIMDANTFSEGWQKLKLIDQLRESVSGVSNSHLIVSGLELQWYMRNQLLRDTDWAGMAHSLEIRVPFVDAALFLKTIPLYPCMRSKKTTVQRFNTSLPEYLFTRKKTGFNVPIKQWRGDMRAWASTVYQEFVF